MQNNNSISTVRVMLNRTCGFALFILVLAISSLMAIDEARAAYITFSEYPLGTTITDQYRNLGVLFSGDTYPPTISIPSFPPLLHQEPSLFCPTVEYSPSGTVATFVNPTDGSPVEAVNVQFNSYVLLGYSVTYTFYDINDAIISQQELKNMYEWNVYFPPKIHKFVITPYPQTYIWIDNLSFQIVPTSCDIDPVCCNSKDPCCGNPELCCQANNDSNNQVSGGY